MKYWTAAPLLCLAALALLNAEAPSLPRGAVVDLAASSRELAPGGLFRIKGTSLATDSVRAEALPLPDLLDGVSVDIDDGSQTRQARLLSVAPGAIEGQLPYGLTGDSITVRVRNAGGASSADRVALAPTAPRLLTEGDLPLAIRGDGIRVSAVSPALAGGNISFYAAGLGGVDPPRPAGEPGGSGTSEDPFNYAAQPVQIFVSGLEAANSFVGLMPGGVGVYQINCTLPASLSSGPHALTLTAGGRSAQLGMVLWVAGAAGREFYVSPAGTSGGDGSKEKPWDLTTAFAHPAAVRPGDTLWMVGGDYGDGKQVVNSQLKGAPGRPVIVRQAPGQRPVIHGGIQIFGEHAWYWGFEIANKFNLDRTKSDAPVSVNLFGPHTKMINTVIHDTAQGIGFWTPAVNAEVYGSLIFYNGYKGSDRGHGHGIYTQNKEGTKLIHDNVIFQQFGVGIHAYGSSAADVEGYDVRGNAVFNNGYLAGGAIGNVDNILFGISKRMDRITVEENFTYNNLIEGGGYSRVGWTFTEVPYGAATVRNNYWVGGHFAVELAFWDKLTFTGNLIYTPNGTNVNFRSKPGQSTESYVWDDNSFYGRQVYNLASGNAQKQEWLDKTGFDKSSRFINGAPSGASIFVRPNRYEPGRAHIVIYNWDKAETIEVDVSKVLTPGSAYILKDAQDFFGEPVLRGVWEGGLLAIPMKARQPMRPTGDTLPVVPVHTLPEFGVFVLLPDAR